MAAPASRYVPEPLSFAVELLRSSLPASSEATPANAAHPAQTPDSTEGLLTLDGPSTREMRDLSEVPQLQLTTVLTKAGSDPYFSSLEFKVSAIAAALGVIERAASLFKEAPALPEVLTPAQKVLRELAGQKALPQVRHIPFLLLSRQVF